MHECVSNARLGLILMVIAGACVLAAKPASADLYSINSIKVDETAENAVEAKKKAISEGQTRAFGTLLHRLTRETDRTRLPELTASQISRLMDGMSVENESTSGTRYVAELSIRFRPSNLRDFLLQYKVPYADEQAPGVLLVTVWKENGKSILWDNPNPWRDAWASLNVENSITPLFLPLGDLTDIGAISAKDVLSGNEQKIQKMKDRYAVENVLIAVAESSGGNSVRAVLRGAVESGPIEFDETFSDESGTGIAGATASAARSYLSRIEEGWKATHLNLGRPAGNSMQVAVPFGTLGEWNQIRQRINTTVGVESVQVKRLSAKGAIIDIIFAGDLGVLSGELERSGFELSDIGDTWVLQVR